MVLVRANARCYVGSPPQFRDGTDPDDWFEYDGPPASYLDLAKGQSWPGGVVPVHVPGIRDGLFGGKGDHDGNGKAGGDAAAKARSKHPNIIHSEGGDAAEAAEQASPPPAAEAAPAGLPADFDKKPFFSQQKLIKALTGKKPNTKAEIAAAVASLQGA